MNKTFLDGYDKLNSNEKIETDFFIYFTKKEKIKSIEKQIEKFITSNNILQNTINTTKFKIDYDMPSIKVKERVDGGKNICNYIEDKFIKEVNKLEKLIEDNNKKIFELTSFKNKMSLETTNISIFLDMIQKELKEIIIKKYKDEKTLIEIGIDLNCSEGTIRKKLKKVKIAYKNFKLSIV